MKIPTTTNIVARTLVWLAAVASPVQGLTGPASGCSCGEPRSQRASECNGCCAAASAGEVSACRCCAARSHGAVSRGGDHVRAASGSGGCCSESSDRQSACQCGVHCQCNGRKHPAPSIPPAVNDTVDKVAAGYQTSNAVATALLPEAFPQLGSHFDAQAMARAPLDRCALLSRFTL